MMEIGIPLSKLATWQGLALTLALIGAWTAAAEGSGCLVCHPGAARGHARGHGFAATDCAPCHGGDPTARAAVAAHRGLEAFPGNLENAARTCGGCHREQLAGVLGSPMTTLQGMIATTRRAIEDDPGAAGDGTVASLGDSPADSLLRKTCASCHLGQPRTRHRHDPVRDRGGGCLACHVNGYPVGSHPELSARVEDARCFGCHSRSSRIALAYAGLGEADEAAVAGRDPASLGRLPDGRAVERLPADVHHGAGLACVDCHTGAEVMSLAPATRTRCSDCHGPGRAVLRAEDLRETAPQALRRSPFPRGPADVVAVTAEGAAPLSNLEIAAETAYLHRKRSGGRVAVPPYRPESHPLAAAHARLTCEACHSQWAPQCHGCHLRFEPGQSQWDHLDRAPTHGRWVERRWGIRNDLPPLGVRADGRIAPFVPGMIMTVAHPRWGEPRLRRLFSDIAPHTIGRARDCASCHREPRALGLGSGRLEHAGGHWRFAPAAETLADGLPADAWTAIDGARRGEATRPGARPLAPGEIRRVLEALP